MSIRLLKTLVAVADHKTFSAAADAVFITHAAVSQQMKTLENDLGPQLFDRSKRTPELTPLAHQILTKARKLIADYDGLVPSVLADNGLSGGLTLGALGTTLTGVTPRAMAVLKARAPDLGLHIRPGLTASMLGEIARGTLDAAIVTQPKLLPNGVTVRPLADETLHLIAAAEETGHDHTALLTTRPFIRFNRTAVLGALIDTWLVRHKLRVADAMELDTTEAITSMVAANLGVSIMPDLAVKPHAEPPLKRISLGPNAPKRTLALAHHDHPNKPQALDALYDALTEVIEAA